MKTFSEKIKEAGEYGIVEQINYPIATVVGLPNVKLREIILFESGKSGEVFSIGRETVQVLIFSIDPASIGERVVSEKNYLTVPVGESLLGHIVDPLGVSLTTSPGFKKPEKTLPIESIPLGIDKRRRIRKAFSTGVALVDVMIPLGCGQKELIIGDRKSGKTSFLLSAIKTQANAGTIVVYAAIAKKKGDIKKIEQFIKDEKLERAVIVVATTSYDSPSLIYLTPFSAMAIAEYFRDKGQDVLVVLDDLSSHARFYREISLLARRFPGRDSYPGDIFYTHARLLERAGNFFHPEKGEASITVLPVAEVVEGDLTGYIPTNLMSITDGHIFFDSNVFFQGRRPAINMSLSVTRVGRQAQSDLLRSVNRELTAFFALYEKMQNLSHFGAELTDTVKKILATGETLYALFDQSYKVILPAEVQLILVSLAWLTIIKVDTKESEKYKEKILSSFEKKEFKKIVGDLISSSHTFNELLESVTKKQKEILHYVE